jgi:hypothetical protein
MVLYTIKNELSQCGVIIFQNELGFLLDKFVTGVIQRFYLIFC